MTETTRKKVSAKNLRKTKKEQTFSFVLKNSNTLELHGFLFLFVDLHKNRIKK